MLTKAQSQLVDDFFLLEKEHGTGTIFFRYVDVYKRVCFVYHKIGESQITVIPETKIDTRTLHGLESRGLLACYNIRHKRVENADSAWRNGIQIIGSRVEIESGGKDT